MSEKALPWWLQISFHSCLDCMGKMSSEEKEAITILRQATVGCDALTTILCALQADVTDDIEQQSDKLSDENRHHVWGKAV